MDSADEGDSPFLERHSTINAVQEICQQRSLTILAGAGVTIDKSGLDWASMVSALLEPHISEESTRSQFIREQGPLFAASAAHELYKAAQDDLPNQDRATRERMVDALKVALYSPGTWQQGRLATNIARFAYTWNSTSLDGVPRRSCIATTNYDDYLKRELDLVFEARRRNYATSKKPKVGLVRPVIAYSTREDPLLKAERVKRAEWQRKSTYPARDEIACIHLHGRIPSSFDPTDAAGLRFPVISEMDYYKTALYSERALAQLFSRSGALLVGASLTDPPLIRALEKTITHMETHPRWALLTLNGGLHDAQDREGQVEHRRLVVSRMRALGVTPIFVDHYLQLAQFFEELAVCAQMPSPEEYATSNLRYGPRLARWWRRWNMQGGTESRAKRQTRHQAFLLRNALPDVRTALRASNDEVLKVEVWLRWQPKRKRVLRLWASSVGTWADESAMREASLRDFNHALATECFVSGRPTIRYADTQDVTARWGVYLATPVWAVASKSFSFVAGVVVVASMSSPDRSAINIARNQSNIATCLRTMETIGQIVAHENSEVLMKAIAKGEVSSLGQALGSI
jgi:hypothetical protein